MKKLENKVAIITGGAQGLGKAGVERFAQEGAQVIIWDVDGFKCLETENEIKSDGYKCHSMVVDTTDFESVTKAAKEVYEMYGSIDILINNAGVTRDATLQKMTVEEWNQVLSVNLTGVFNCSKAVTPYMIESNFGKIINTSSVVGLYGNYGQTNYAATKAGVIGMTKSLAKELGKHNITVNAVAPGFMKTDMINTIPEKVQEAMVAKTALRRMGNPADIANAYLFLASEEASFITGTVLSVDGGIGF